MMQLMIHVVLDEKTKRDGFIVAHAAHHPEAVFGDSVHDGHQ
jgi:hypothetical protein